MSRDIRYITVQSTKAGVADSRIVECFCARCGEKYDGVTQLQDVDGAWQPDPAISLDALGWHVENDRLYCSKRCVAFAAYAERSKGAPLRAVLAMPGTKAKPQMQVKR